MTTPASTPDRAAAVVNANVGRVHDVATWVPLGTAAPSIPSQEAGNTALSNAANAEAQEMHRAAFDLSAIAPILTAGFHAVLLEASKRGVLDPPHGQTPMPEPKKIIENDPRFGKSAGYEGRVDDKMDQAPTRADSGQSKCNALTDAEAVGCDDRSTDDDDDEKLLEYEFDYGFNPLVYLGEYLRRESPTTILARKDKHDANLAYLRRRAIKCLERETTFRELSDLVVHRRAGIVHGPIVGDLSARGGILWARAYRSGQLEVTLSRREDFRSICWRKSSKVDSSSDHIAVIEFDNLDPNTTWHHRTYLYDPEKGFDGPAAGFCIKGKFSTLPDGDGESDQTCRFVVFSLHGLGRETAATNNREEIEGACSAVLAAEPDFCLVLGGPSTPSGTTAGRSGIREGFDDLQETAARVPALALLLQTNGFLTASGVVSKAAAKKSVNREDGQMKVNGPERGSSGVEGPNAGNSRRTEGSTPEAESYIIEEGGDENALASPAWPLRCPDSWGSHSLGPDLEIFLLDAWNGSLGDDQLVWVSDAIRESGRTWKVIACGVPVGFSTGDASTCNTGRAEGASAPVPRSPRPLAVETPIIEMQAKHVAANFAAIQVEMQSSQTTRRTPTRPSLLPPLALRSHHRMRSPQLQPSSISPAEEPSSPVSTIAGDYPGTQIEEEATQVGSGAKGGGRSDKASVLLATLQIQGMVTQLHESGCRNVVLLTPATRSRPHALSFFSGLEAKGFYPVYELGCCGLLSTLGSGAEAAADKPCPKLEPVDLMPELTKQTSTASSDGVVAMACSVLVGNGRGLQETEAFASRDDRLSFVVHSAGGEEMATLKLAPAR